MATCHSVTTTLSHNTSPLSANTYTNPNPTFTVSADGNTEFTKGIEVEGDITVDGLSLIERLENIEEILGLPKRNTELEKKYPHLKKLYESHIEIRKVSEYATIKYTEELEKLRTFEILNTDDSTN